MSVEKINPVYTLNEKAEGDTLSASEWNNLSSAVNAALVKINEVIDNPSSGGSSGGGSSSTDSHISMNNKGNLTIATTEADKVNNKGGKINIEPISDLQIKPGDDITLYSHHRESEKQDEVSVKVLNGAESTEYPVKLQLNLAEMTLTTKDKTGKDANVLDININKGTDQKGYLKVRAQAIDLRCEEKGGIALQPKGADNQGFMNKIKFEHGGGDGLEFGTFNSEKTSIFTDEYRFNKEGIWKMANRVKVTSDKADVADATTAYKYIKNNSENNAAQATATGKTYEAADDFYDFIENDDVQCTTKDIIKTAKALNGTERIHTKITSKGNLELASLNGWSYAVESLGVTSGGTASLTRATQILIVKKGAIDSATNDTCISVTIDGSVSKLLPGVTAGSWSGVTVTELQVSTGYYAFDFSEHSTDATTITVSSPQGPYVSAFIVPKALFEATYYYNAPSIEANTVYALSDVVSSFNLSTSNASALENRFKNVDTVELLANFSEAPTKYTFTKTEAAGINIEGDGDIKVTAGGTLALKGILDFGSNFNFGETDEGIATIKKFTKKGSGTLKNCDTIRVIAVNNHTTNNCNFNSCYDSQDQYATEHVVSLGPGETAILAEASLYDIIKLVGYMKTMQQGPWQAQQ